MEKIVQFGLESKFAVILAIDRSVEGVIKAASTKKYRPQ